MLHVVDVGSPVSRLPRRPWITVASAAGLHLVAAFAMTGIPPRSAPPTLGTRPLSPIASPAEVRHVVFIVRRPDLGVGGGGGGGGNRRAEPIRHAEAPGSDAMTLRVIQPVSTVGTLDEVTAPSQLVLDALPLASGTVDHVGLLLAGVPFGTATGPGSGGGVGEGVGTGIGSGQGPGMGPGSGGGIGGGPYRPGGSVTTPRLILQVSPAYTAEALRQRIEGTVVLELVVRANGVPSQVRVVRPLDPGGLDEQAIAAVTRWRFEPGILAGAPVDVLVTVMVDFRIR